MSAYGTSGLSSTRTLDRRLATRVPARLKVWCEGEDFTLLTESINVSKLGIFVRAGSPPALGTRFRAIIEDLGIVAHVEVRWARSDRGLGRAGMGLHVLAFEQGAGALLAHIERTRRGPWHDLENADSPR